MVNHLCHGLLPLLFRKKVDARKLFPESADMEVAQNLEQSPMAGGRDRRGRGMAGKKLFEFDARNHPATFAARRAIGERVSRNRTDCNALHFFL